IRLLSCQISRSVKPRIISPLIDHPKLKVKISQMGNTVLRQYCQTIGGYKLGYTMIYLGVNMIRLTAYNYTPLIFISAKLQRFFSLLSGVLSILLPFLACGVDSLLFLLYGHTEILKFFVYSFY